MAVDYDVVIIGGSPAGRAAAAAAAQLRATVALVEPLSRTEEAGGELIPNSIHTLSQLGPIN